MKKHLGGTEEKADRRRSTTVADRERAVKAEKARASAEEEEGALPSYLGSGYIGGGGGGGGGAADGGGGGNRVGAGAAAVAGALPPLGAHHR